MFDRISRHTDIILALGLVGILGVMILPLPPVMIDFLLTLAISSSIVLLLTSVYRPHFAIAAAFFMFGLDQLGIDSHSIFMNYGYLTNVIIGAIISIAYIRLFSKKFLLSLIGEIVSNLS